MSSNKSQLAEKLIEYPLLRVLLFEFWFRVVFVFLVVFVLGLLLILPKIWRTSKAGFEPEIKVSGLDMVQAWSLKRTARAATSQKQYPEALQAWMSAIGNNQADTTSVEGYLRTVLDMEWPDRSYLVQSMQNSMWLLKLTDTNQTSLEIVADVFDRYSMHDYSFMLLEGRPETLSPRLQATYLKGLFERGNFQEFNQAWDNLKGTVKMDADLPLYRHAYLALWGSSEEGQAARAALSAAKENPRQRLLSHRLDLTIFNQTEDLENYRKSLEVLTDNQAAGLRERVAYWRMLYENGQKEAAIKLLQAYSNPLTSPMEVTTLSNFYLELGLTSQARDLLKDLVPKFSYEPLISLLYSKVLSRMKAWDELRDLAVKIRLNENRQFKYSSEGLSYFLEGKAEYGQERNNSAEAAFEQSAKTSWPSDVYLPIGFNVGRELLEIRYFKPALAILKQVVDDHRKSPEFWHIYFSAAYGVKDLEEMSLASKNAYELEPSNLTYINNYAATLLINRENPEAAIRLTFDLYQANPISIFAKINHSHALLLSQRIDDAFKLLKEIDPQDLTSVELNGYYFALFQLSCYQSDLQKAEEYQDLIDQKLLFPNQINWMETTLQSLKNRAPSQR